MRGRIRTISIILILVLFSFMFSACGKSGEDKNNSEKTVSVTQGASDKETPDNNTEDNDNPNSANNSENGNENGEIKELKCMSGNGYVADLKADMNGRILASYAKSADGASAYFFCLISAQNDKIEAEIETGQNIYMPLGSRSNNEILALDAENKTILRLDDKLSELGRLSYAGEKVWFDYDEDCIYTAGRGSLDKIGFDGETEHILSLKNSPAIEHVDVKGRHIIVTSPPVNESMIEAYAVYSFDGTEMLYKEDRGGYYGFAGNRLLFMDSGEESTEGGRLIVYDGDASWSGSAYKIDGNCTLYGFDDSEYAGIKQSIYNSEAENYSVQLSLIDTENGEKYTIASFDDNPQTFFDFENGSFVCAASDDKGTAIYVFTPEMLKDSTECEKTEVPENVRPEKKALSAELSEAEEYAKELEEKYNICILLNDQIEIVPEFDFDYISTGTLDIEEELQLVNSALHAIDSILSYYPEGFADVFKNYRGEGGLRFVLAAKMDDVSGNFPAAGEYTVSGAWHNINLATVYSVYDVLDHEIWHAVEGVAGNIGIAVDEVKWSGFNAEGFEYLLDRDDYSAAEDMFTFHGGDRENVCVSREYSFVNSAEDRATLIELVLDRTMGSGWYDTLKSYPHLKAKLEYLEEISRELYGYVYWEKIIENKGN